MSTSKKIGLGCDFDPNDPGQTRLVKANGQYIKQIDLDIVDEEHMRFKAWNGQFEGIGWDNNRSWDTDTQIDGYPGKKTIWKYDDYDSRTMSNSVWPLCYIDSGGTIAGGYYGADYPVTRTTLKRRGDWMIRHKCYVHSSGGDFSNLPKPTFKLKTLQNSELSNLASVVKNLPVDTDISYDNWENTTSANNAHASHPITISCNPYIPDVSMYVESCTTPNMFAPENISEYVILKQPSIYANIGLIDRLDQPHMGFSIMRSSWQYNSAYPQHYLRVGLHTGDWDSISTMSISWSITGGKANYFDKTSGTISNFQWIDLPGTQWAHYAWGFVPFHLATSNDIGVNTNFNIVANGLKFDANVTTTKVIQVF
tara:strand:- start:1101 stop:2204 length:1104 start_codon:yes stop_codon:yes gene_type:complete